MNGGTYTTRKLIVRNQKINLRSVLNEMVSEKIMDGTRKYLATIKDKQYQKHPTTFLNGENYNDEYEAIPVQPDNPYANLY